MASPNRRTWTLAGLDRGCVYSLYFDPAERRWEVAVLGAIAATEAGPAEDGDGRPHGEAEDGWHRTTGPDAPQRGHLTLVRA